MTRGPDMREPPPVSQDIAARLLPIAEWLVIQGVAETKPQALLDGLCRRLNADGVPVGRMQIAFRILHPLFGAATVTWDEAAGAVLELREGERGRSAEFTVSPFATLLDGGQRMMHQRIDTPEAAARYPIFALLAERGYTDYLAFLVPFGEGLAGGEVQAGIMVSFTTRRAGGFEPGHLEALRWICGPLALALKADMNREIAANALRTFHGSSVGDRILGGMIRRGSGERISTVIWYSDLRNSTTLGDTMELDRFLALLNSYFDCSAGAILEHGGQVLELIGDAVLGIFPAENGLSGEEVTRAAISAARQSRRKLRSLGGTEPAIAFGVGLHFGEVIFGNVGTPDRLSFGLVGGAVSEAARIEGMTKTLAAPVIVSDTVAMRAGEPLEDLGLHSLRGVTSPRRLWALPTD